MRRLTPFKKYDMNTGVTWIPLEYVEQLPSAQPYTEAEIQKMQDLEQAQFDKMYELGKQAAREDLQPTCNQLATDCISRQAAINAIENTDCEMTSNDWDELTDAIMRVPSAQPEPQWIPCSKPPEESGTYIVTAYDGTDKRVTFVKYQKTLKRWDLTGARAYWRILAYKPLPEPWRGEDDAQDCP